MTMSVEPTERYADGVDGDRFDRGDRVEFAYITGDDETRSGTGVVCKAPSSKVVVLVDGASRRSALRVFRTGTPGVFRNNREGNGRTRRVGTNATLERTGEVVDVEYRHHSGWFV